MPGPGRRGPPPPRRPSGAHRAHRRAATRSPAGAEPGTLRPVAARADLPSLVQPGEAGLRAVLLVEGVSDREAVLAAARGLGRDLPAEGVSVVAMGGRPRSAGTSR